VRNAVLNALSNANQRMLVSLLEAGEWEIAGNELVIKVSQSATVIDMSLSTEAKRMVIATASGVLGRPLKLKIIPGAAVQPTAQPPAKPSTAPNGNGGRSRAEQDPVVRRMKEKFGAEIRTIIDYKEKR